MLDDKLKKIIEKYAVWGFEKSGEAQMIVNIPDIVQEVKQVFAEEGYRPKSTQELEKRFGLMTGQEWLTRFENEMPNVQGAVIVQLEYRDIMERAKRASGLIDKYKED